MTEKKAIYIFIVLFTIYCNAFAQFSNKNESGWVLGLGTNAIIDSGESLKDFLDFDRTYHLSRPFKVSIEKKLNLNHGIELRATSNKFVTSKTFNSGVLTEDIDFFSLDASYKYHFKSEQFRNNNLDKLSGYGTIGLGQSWYNRDNKSDFNDTQMHIGAGVNYKIYQEIMLNFQLIGKLSITEDIANNYVQMDLGVVFPINFSL